MDVPCGYGLPVICFLVGFSTGGCADRGKASAPPAPEVPQARVRSKSTLAFYVGPWRFREVPRIIKDGVKGTGWTFGFDEQRSVTARLQDQAAGKLGSDPSGRRIEAVFFDMIRAGGYQDVVLTENGPWSQNDRLQGLKPAIDKFAQLAQGFSPGARVWVEETWPCRDTGTKGGCKDDPFSLNSDADWPTRVRGDESAWDHLVAAVGQTSAGKPEVELIPTARLLLLVHDRAKAGKVHDIGSYKDLFNGTYDLSPAGLYFVACVHFRCLTGASAKQIGTDAEKLSLGKLDKRTMLDLQAIADEGVPSRS